MKQNLFSISVILLITQASCGQSAQERAAKEKATSDSIAFADRTHLSRENAKVLIAKYYNLPQPEDNDFLPQYVHHAGDYQTLINQGLITATQDLNPNSGWTDWYLINLTAKGNPYLRGTINTAGGYHFKVKTCELNINEVTGIQKNDQANSAIVEFNLKRSNITPFGQFLNTNMNELISKQLKFSLYDDGWRIVQ